MSAYTPVMAYPSTLLLLTLLIRKTAKPMMSTYSVDVLPVATSSTIGIRRVTVCPSAFVPVAGRVRGYSPAGSVPPLRDRDTDWLAPFERLKLDGETDT